MSGRLRIWMSLNIVCLSLVASSAAQAQWYRFKKTGPGGDSQRRIPQAQPGSASDLSHATFAGHATAPTPVAGSNAQRSKVPLTPSVNPAYQETLRPKAPAILPISNLQPKPIPTGNATPPNQPEFDIPYRAPVSSAPPQSTKPGANGLPIIMPNQLMGTTRSGQIAPQVIPGQTLDWSQTDDVEAPVTSTAFEDEPFDSESVDDKPQPLLEEKPPATRDNKPRQSFKTAPEQVSEKSEELLFDEPSEPVKNKPAETTKPAENDLDLPEPAPSKPATQPKPPISPDPSADDEPTPKPKSATETDLVPPDPEPMKPMPNESQPAETADEKPAVEKPAVEKPVVEKPTAEKPAKSDVVTSEPAEQTPAPRIRESAVQLPTAHAETNTLSRSAAEESRRPTQLPKMTEIDVCQAARIRPAVGGGDAALLTPPNQAQLITGMRSPIHHGASFNPPWMSNRNTYPFCHNPLYFEDPNLERCGYHYSCLTTPVSAALFGASLVTLPYKVGAEPPWECVRSLSDCRYGYSYGWDAYWPPYSLSGSAAQAAATVGLIFIVP